MQIPMYLPPKLYPICRQFVCDDHQPLVGSPLREKIQETISSDGILTPGRGHSASASDLKTPTATHIVESTRILASLNVHSSRCLTFDSLSDKEDGTVLSVADMSISAIHPAMQHEAEATQNPADGRDENSRLFGTTMQMFAPASRRVNLSEMHMQNEQEEGSVSMELTGMIDATANVASELFAINQDTMAIFEHKSQNVKQMHPADRTADGRLQLDSTGAIFSKGPRMQQQTPASPANEDSRIFGTTMQMFAPFLRKVDQNEVQEEGSATMELTGMANATAAADLSVINQETMAIFSNKSLVAKSVSTVERRIDRKSHLESPGTVPKKHSKLQPSTPIISPARAAEQSQQTLSTLSNMESPKSAPRNSRLQPSTPTSARAESSRIFGNTMQMFSSVSRRANSSRMQTESAQNESAMEVTGVIDSRDSPSLVPLPAFASSEMSISTQNTMAVFSEKSPSPVPVVPVVERVSSSSSRKSHMDSPRAVPKKLSKLQPSTPISPARAAEQSQQTLSNIESPGTVPRKHSKLQPQTPVSVRKEPTPRKELEKGDVGLAQTQAAVKKSGLEMKQRQVVEEQQKKEEPQQIPLADAIRARIQYFNNLADCLESRYAEKVELLEELRKLRIAKERLCMDVKNVMGQAD
ncbi:hypothetical protein WR25_00898 isoform B [Diploscapter pachys]|uniref:Uncharacterized protein n=1 Tax=Diploscapter pachys TaxID=2018661 RepID=A0A2A2KVI4_9BILA|nr:hypothetical protein WR25_00898 isoform B [Diploscapter pachys]